MSYLFSLLLAFGTLLVPKSLHASDMRDYNCDVKRNTSESLGELTGSFSTLIGKNKIILHNELEAHCAYFERTLGRTTEKVLGFGCSFMTSSEAKVYGQTLFFGALPDIVETYLRYKDVGYQIICRD